MNKESEDKLIAVDAVALCRMVYEYDAACDLPDNWIAEINRAISKTVDSSNICILPREIFEALMGDIHNSVSGVFYCGAYRRDIRAVIEKLDTNLRENKSGVNFILTCSKCHREVARVDSREWVPGTEYKCECGAVITLGESKGEKEKMSMTKTIDEIHPKDMDRR